MAFCTNCGSKIDDEARFCPDCGAPVVPEAPKAEEKADEELIDIDTFAKVKLKVAKVVAAEAVKKSNKLLKLTVKCGETVLKAQKKMVMTPGEMEKVVIDLGKVDQDVAVCVEEG